MNFTPSYNYPMQQNRFGLNSRQQNISSITIPQNPPLEKRTIGMPTTPMSVKDIDEQIRKLNQQYQIKTGIPLDLKEKTSRNISATQSAENFGVQKKVQPGPPYNPQTLKNPPKHSSQLSSADYLRSPSSINQSTKILRDSQSTAIGDFYRSQPSFTQGILPIKPANIENDFKFRNIQNSQISSEIKQLKVQTNILTIDRDWKYNQSKSVLKTQVQTPYQTSPIQTKAQIFKTTKPTSQFLRITQPLPKPSVKPNLQKKYQRKPNHQRQSIRYREMSLPHISQNSKVSGDGGNYIESINQRNRIIVQLQTTISKLQNKIQQNQQLLQRYKFDIQNIKQTNKSTSDASHHLINKLKRQIQLNDVKRHSSNMDLQSKFHKINLDNQQISANNNILQKEIANLKKQLSKKKESEQINENMYSKLKSIIVEKTSHVTELQKSLDRMTQQNNSLRRRVSEIITQSKFSKTIMIDEDKNQIFNSIMKMNQQQNIKFKNNLAVKDQQIYRLEDLNREYRAINDTLRYQIEIQKLKRITDLKNLETTFKIEEQVKINQINSLNKTLQSLEQKLKYIVQEDRKKDQFMIQYLRNRSETPEDKLKIQQFFKKFQMLSVNTNIVQCLKREQAEIEALKTEVRKLILRK